MKNPISRLTCAALAALATLCAGCGETGSSRPGVPNVILICMDTVRADHVGSYGYEARPTTPALDELARRGIVFTDTSATAGWTKPSVPSYLTSTYPLQHGVYLGDSKGRLETETDVLPADAYTMAEVFSLSGYQTAAFVRNAQLRKGLGFEQGFDLYDDQPGDAREIRWRAQDWLSHRDEERPFFLYLHFLDAHWPYPVPDDYAFKFVEGNAAERFRRKDWRDLRKQVNRGEVTLLEEEVAALVGLYDGAIRYIDDQIGLLLEELRKEGLEGETIICVIADHGEEFMEHGKIGHGHGLYENLLQVPWIMSVPGLEAGTFDSPCSLVDLLPTLAGAAGLSAGDAAMGVNLLGSSNSDRLIFAEHLNESYYQQTFRRADSKLLVDMRPGPGLEIESPAGPVLDKRLRWKVDLVADAQGRLALTVEPEPEDDAMEPTEIKGVIERLRGNHFDLCGVPVVLAEATVFYGDGATTEGAATLRAGMLVKAKGAMSDDDVFIPEKLKVYGAGAVTELELRGRLMAVEDDGRLNIGGVWVRTDSLTEIKGGKDDGQARLSRALLYDLFASGDDPSQDERVALEAVLYDLRLDPREQAGEALSAVQDALSRDQEFVRAISRLRLWGSGDRVVISPEELKALRAIGYAE